MGRAKSLLVAKQTSIGEQIVVPVYTSAIATHCNTAIDGWNGSVLTWERAACDNRHSFAGWPVSTTRDAPSRVPSLTSTCWRTVTYTEQLAFDNGILGGVDNTTTLHNCIHLRMDHAPRFVRENTNLNKRPLSTHMLSGLQSEAINHSGQMNNSVKLHVRQTILASNAWIVSSDDRHIA